MINDKHKLDFAIEQYREIAKRVKDINVGWTVNSNLTKDLQKLLLEIFQEP